MLKVDMALSEYINSRGKAMTDGQMTFTVVMPEREFQERSTEAGFVRAEWQEEDDSSLIRRWYWMDYLGENTY